MNQRREYVCPAIYGLLWVVVGTTEVLSCKRVPHPTPVSPAVGDTANTPTLQQHVRERSLEAISYNMECDRMERIAAEYIQGRFHDTWVRARCGRTISAHAPSGTWDCIVRTNTERDGGPPLAHYYDVSCIGTLCAGIQTE